MSLTDKESDISKNLRKLLIAFRQDDEIDLTPFVGAQFLIRHLPKECRTCTDSYQEVRKLGMAHPDLFDKDGNVNEAILATIDAGQRQRLYEIAQRLDMHLKEFSAEEQERLTRKSKEKGRFQW